MSADASPAAALAQVGARVRVRLDDGRAARATLLTVDAAEVDALLDADGAELRLPLCRVEPLEPFELQPRPAPSAEQRKEEGNVLFRRGDYDAAMEAYTRALRACEPPALSAGARVLVRPGFGAEAGGGEGGRGAEHVRAALVLTADAGELVDVLYVDAEADGAEGEAGPAAEDEEARLPARALIGVGRCALLRAQLYTNLARTATRRGQRLEPVAWAERALCCAAHVEEAEARRGLALKALYVLARAELGRSNYGGAQAACGRGLRLARAAGAAEAEWAALGREVARRRAQSQQQNRRLAREVSKWVGGVIDGEGGVEGAVGPAGREATRR